MFMALDDPHDHMFSLSALYPFSYLCINNPPFCYYNNLSISLSNDQAELGARPCRPNSVKTHFWNPEDVEKSISPPWKPPVPLCRDERVGSIPREDAVVYNRTVSVCTGMARGF